MRHTKPLSRQPAGVQLACRKVYEGRPSAQLGSVSAWQTFKPCFPFHLHKKVYVWTSDRRVCVCIFCGDHLNHLCCDLLVGGASGEAFGPSSDLESTTGL